jgi:DNA-binding transcriptional LysR family regulator
MDIRQLRYFIALAETLHFGRAAQRLHITQPPLSRQIASLESSLGTPLFLRNSRSVALTPAGEDFLCHAKRLLSDLDLAVRSAQATARGEQGELRIGFTMYAAWNVLPGLLKRYAERQPEVRLTLRETLPRDLLQALNAGEIDLGIAFPTPVAAPLNYQPLFREPLCAVLPATHPLAEEAIIDAGALAGERFVTFPRSTSPALHAAVMACCEQAGFEPNIHLETHLQQTIVNLVAAGIGVALVPDSMRRMQLPDAVFRPLMQSPKIEQGVFWNARNAAPCLSGFLECTQTPPMPED